MNRSMPGLPVHHQLPEFTHIMPIESVMPSSHLIICHPLLLLPSIFPNIRVFSNESALRIRWPKDWSFSFNISPTNEYSGLIFFRIDWLDILAVQGTLKSLLQHHSSKASILRALSSLYSPTLTSIHNYWKNHSLEGLAVAAATKSLQPCPTLCDPIDGSPPGSPSLGFYRQEHWSRLPFPSPMHEREK